MQLEARHVIGIGGMVTVQANDGRLITHALGSCLGIAIWDSHARVGGLLHAQLPMSTLSQARAAELPTLFVDLGIPMLFNAAAKLGGEKRRMRVTVAGGANMTAIENDQLNIAKRNLVVMRKLFWQNGVLIAGEDTGGDRPRTMALDLATGVTHLESLGRRYQL